MKTENKWTKFSDALPPEEMPNVFLKWTKEDKVTTSTRAKNEKWSEYAEIMKQTPGLLWHPITYPSAPKEQSQAEKDEEAFMEWVGEETSFIPYMRGAWRAALAWERAENAKDLQELKGAGWAWPALDRLRRRAGLDK